MSPLILICAAGKSIRFEAGDKLMADVHGKAVLEHVLIAAKGSGFDVRLAVPNPDHPRAKLGLSLGVSILANSASSEGLGGTLRAAVSEIPSAVTHLIVVLADHPGISTNAIKTLWNHRLKSVYARIWRLEARDGCPGHPVMFHRDLFPEFACLRGDVGAQPILAAHKGKVMGVPFDGFDPNFDVDTLEDLARFRDLTTS